ncbi:MAG: peptide ABC transporter substrate-binding protein, partial [Coxiellaceae bacterium]|nr:peptide ABC transporter substrate-binding protein [Coxiellaceae bacterium]
RLVPLTAVEMPRVTYVDEQGQTLPENTPAENIRYSIYDITIKPGIYYQPHPAFAMVDGKYRYHQLTEEEIEDLNTVADLPYVGTKELTVDDYIIQIKRLALPALHSPIYGVMARYIKGLDDLQARLATAHKMVMKQLDLRTFSLSGVKKIDDYHFQIIINGKYPQFMYWLAMPFFAPVPWQVDHFFSQPGMNDNNLTLSWYPVGTGPYMLTENNPNKAMVLAKNPNFHGEVFPNDGSEADIAKGYMANAGLEMPFVDKIVFSLEKESIPRWTKFLQGYYDNSAISSDSFDQAITVDSNGEPDLTSELKDKGIRLSTVVSPMIFYLGFNMMDPIVGGASERARKLRQAISIAVDYKEYIAIFLNGRGIVAEGPIPPGIFGYAKRPNPIMNKSLAQAQALLAEAGYPQGMDAQTGVPLVLNYDVPATSGPDDKARFSWMR